MGGVTSRTYEANLFGIIYLLSSAVIFNTMFPVDASTVANLNAHASHALHMVQALQEGGRRVLRRKPQLIWSVQSFNMFNLRNDGINAEDLFSALRNASQPDASVEPAFRAVLGGGGEKSPISWLVGDLFDEQQLVPVRRPHASDEIVANLGGHDSSLLSEEYLQVHLLPTSACLGSLASACRGLPHSTTHSAMTTQRSAFRIWSSCGSLQHTTFNLPIIVRTVERWKNVSLKRGMGASLLRRLTHG